MIPIITILLLCALVAVWLGDNLSQALPEVHVAFDRKPLNCRPCLSFHLTWIFSALCASLINSFTMLVWGVVLAFIVFAILKYIDNKKIEK